MKNKLISIKSIEALIKKEEEKNKQNGLNLKTKNLILTLFIAGKEKGWKLRILEHSQNNFYNDGTYNKKRNCYYPKDLLSYENIAEFNKLEKLFKKWGFTSL